MAISFSDAPGNLFVAIGRLGKLLMEAQTYQTNQNSNFTGTNEAIQQFILQPDIQSLLGSAYQGNLNSIGDSTGSLIQNVGQSWINRVVFLDSPQPNQSLTQINLIGSIQNVILQMNQQGASVLQATVTATPSTFTGTGNGVIVASLIRPQDGLIQQLAFAESIQVLCTNDSYSGGATEGNEAFSLLGEGSQTDVFAFNWPIGSGSSNSLNAINGDASTSQGNFLNNSNFADWTSNVPDQWVLEVGTAGTDIMEESTIVFGDGHSLQIVGDGATLTAISQTFADTDGTPAIIDDLTSYGVNLWLRRDGVAAAAGTLVVEVIDVDTGMVLQDEGGNNATFSIDLTALTTSFVAYNGTFRTPAVLPSEVKLRLRLSTALTNGRSVYVGKAAMGQGVRQYSGGPYVWIFSGDTPFVQGTYAALVIANDRGGSLNNFQPLFQQLYSVMITSELQLPYNSSPTISNQIIQRA